MTQFKILCFLLLLNIAISYFNRNTIVVGQKIICDIVVEFKSKNNKNKAGKLLNSVVCTSSKHSKKIYIHIMYSQWENLSFIRDDMNQLERFYWPKIIKILVKLMNKNKKQNMKIVQSYIKNNNIINVKK